MRLLSHEATTTATDATDTTDVVTATDVTAHLIAADAAKRSGVLTTLRRAGVALTTEPHGSPDTVIVAAAGTVDEALFACPPSVRSGCHRMLVLAERFSPADVVRALRFGIRVMLHIADTTPSRLVAALQSARDGDGRLPHELLVGALTAPPAPHPTVVPVTHIPAPRTPADPPTAGPRFGTFRPGAPGVPAPETDRALPGASPLTARQTRVLALMAEGQDNATIARSLVCSEHTVKNVIYDLMSRLQVRNRAHAVAHGIQSGLI